MQVADKQIEFLHLYTKMSFFVNPLKGYLFLLLWNSP